MNANNVLVLVVFCSRVTPTSAAFLINRLIIRRGFVILHWGSSRLRKYTEHVRVRWTVWNYPISGYHSNELLSINTLHLYKSRRRSVGHERSSIILFHCIVCIVWVLIIFSRWFVKCRMLYTRDCLHVCYSLHTALSVRLGVLFDNV
jgi:hypothetical protein